MELPGSSYLYTLALLAITYGGFAALFMLFRKKLPGELVHYDAFLIRGVVQKGFIVAACSMLPPLLAYCDLSHPTIWRLSSLVAGVLQGLFLVTWLSRRRVVNMRANGVRKPAAWCLGRGGNHYRVLDVIGYADDTSVPSFGLRLRCERCGHLGADVRPNWNEAAA